jgi:hypothetical protein
MDRAEEVAVAYWAQLQRECTFEGIAGRSNQVLIKRNKCIMKKELPRELLIALLGPSCCPASTRTRNNLFPVSKCSQTEICFLAATNINTLYKQKK